MAIYDLDAALNTPAIVATKLFESRGIVQVS